MRDSVVTSLLNRSTAPCSPYSTQYTGGGDQAIIDGIRGTVNFASGEWQGVQGKTYEAVVDLQRETAIKELGGSFLQVAFGRKRKYFFSKKVSSKII